MTSRSRSAIGMRSRKRCLSPDTLGGHYADPGRGYQPSRSSDIAAELRSVRKLYGTAVDPAATFDTPHMRIAGVSLLVACVAALLATADVRAAGPTLRTVPGPSLAVAGTGFVPRTIVLLRLKGPDVARLVRVRSGRNGGFLVRFAVANCALTSVTATGVRGRVARVPIAWFVRECPPPPPLDPAPTPY